MPINDDVSNPIIQTEKHWHVQMDPINEINSQFAIYVLLDTHMLHMLTN